jgi:hypothetical protein
VRLAAFVALLLIGATGWILRYAYLSPVVYRDPDDAKKHVVVVCKVNRWTAYPTCQKVWHEDELTETWWDEMLRWAKDQLKDQAKK